MIRKLLCMAAAVLILSDGALAAPKKHASMGRVVKVIMFPVAHPAKTVKGVLYGVLNTVGTVVDGVEYVTSEIASGVSKVDGIIDGAETKTSPVQTGVQNGVSHPDTATPRAN